MKEESNRAYELWTKEKPTVPELLELYKLLQEKETEQIQQ